MKNETLQKVRIKAGSYTVSTPDGDLLTIIKTGHRVWEVTSTKYDVSGSHATLGAAFSAIVELYQPEEEHEHGTIIERSTVSNLVRKFGATYDRSAKQLTVKVGAGGSYVFKHLHGGKYAVTHSSGAKLLNEKDAQDAQKLFELSIAEQVANAVLYFDSGIASTLQVFVSSSINNHTGGSEFMIIQALQVLGVVCEYRPITGAYAVTDTLRHDHTRIVLNGAHLLCDLDSAYNRLVMGVK